MTSTAGVEIVDVSRPRRLHTLTVLRFVAALYVVLHHAIGPDRPFGIRSGFVGVTFFFVLSGFVLTWTHRPEVGSRAFWRNRAARILPIYLLVGLAGAFVPLAAEVSWRTVVTYATLTQSWFFDGSLVHGLNDPAWSLSDEAFFYAVFPLFVFVARRALRTPLAIAAAGAGIWILIAAVAWAAPRYIPLQAYWFTYTFPPYRFGEFALGVLLALLWRTGWRPRVPARVVGLVALLLLAAYFLVDWRSGDLPRAYADALVTPAVVAVLLWAVCAEHGGRPPRWTPGWAVRLGEWSFALYLVHRLVIRTLSWATGGDPRGYLPGWAVITTVVVSITLAGLLCELVEKPLERRLRSPRSTDVRGGERLAQRSV